MLKQSTTTKLRKAITGNLPPRTFTITNASPARTVQGYLQRSGELTALDALGFRRLDARIHLSSGVLSPGDEVDDFYVIWEVDLESTFQAYVARRIPAFDDWVVRRRALVGRDPVTNESIYEPQVSTVGVHLVEFRPNADDELSGVNQEGKGTGVTRPGVLLVGDDVQHPQYGRYGVEAVIKYGPWERVVLGRA